MSWKTPKTDWKHTDNVNIEDYNRWIGNIAYLKELSLEVYKAYTLVSMGEEKGYADYVYADEINAIEANLAAICANTYPFPVGSQQTYYPNQPTPDYTEFNRLESACLLIYNNLIGQINGRKRLIFTLGGERF